MIPFKEFILFHSANIEGIAPTPPGTFADPSDWTTTHYRYCKLGYGYLSTNVRTQFRPVFIPKEKDFELVDGLDVTVKAHLDLILAKTLDTCSPALDDCDLIYGILNDPSSPKVWHKYKVTGRHYDGTNLWDRNPPYMIGNPGFGDIQMADLPKLYPLIMEAYRAGVGCFVNKYQEELFRLGLCGYLSNFNPGLSTPSERVYLSCEPSSLRVFYLNPIVNSLSVKYAKTTGNKELILTGLGFKNSNAEMDEGGASNPGAHAVGWEDNVLYIDFIGLQGQGTTTLRRTASPADFTVTNTEIIIPSARFPTLAKGTYELYLRKYNAGGLLAFPEGYAGDWRTDPLGRIYKGNRFTFLIDDDYVEKGFRSKRSPMMLINMSFKNRQGTLFQQPIAEMDVRTSNKIYRGFLLNYSSINRAVNDKAGNFKGTSMELDLSNHNKDYSITLHDYPVLKNQEVEIAVAQMDEPESWKIPLLKMIVDDYHLKGTSFKVVLKDLAQKIFNKTVPKRICTTADYPNLSDDYVGAAMPEVLGLNVLGVGKYPGAVEAAQVSADVYLASYRTLKSIDAVYSDYSVVGGWTVFYDHGGRTYIRLAGQDDKVITFDCKGCMFKDWNSVNGYIENPAYILLHYITKIMEVRLADIVRYSFDEVAALFESIAEETSGRLIIQNTQRASTEMKQLLFDYETKAFVATDGRLEIGKKDISNYSSDLLIFDQADLQESADRKWNQDESINRVKVESDYYPSADKFKSGEEDEKADLIEEIDETREDTRGRDREDRRRGRRAER